MICDQMTSSANTITRGAPRRATQSLVECARVGLIAGFFGGMIFLGAGCQKALFPENQPRTQFEAYEIMRQRYVPLQEPDVFGTPRPAVRARLTPER